MIVSCCRCIFSFDDFLNERKLLIVAVDTRGVKWDKVGPSIFVLYTKMLFNYNT